MTKYSLLIGLLALVGCTSDKGDTGDTSADTDTDDTDTDTPVAWDLVSFSGDCAAEVCIYRMTTSREAGNLILWIAETGDPSEERWTEEHTGFNLTETNSDGSEVYELRLDWVTTPTAQIANETTLLNPTVLAPNYANWGDGLTWTFEASSDDGTEVDCAVTGHDPAYYTEYCDNIE